ncbi:PadR family transcriptional regulator [Allohahella marinimesophila]|uniref:PadR family transcriptional regulator n=1 Tax=Allohahella marinimesophila TaxID=1054972 RepID=A0ABP7NGV1_9GAMM
MSLKHAVLAMLELEPGTGYDLIKRFNKSIGHFWAATHQQVYQTLNTLSEEGRVEFELVEQSDKPNKKIYSITSAGLEELRAWTATPAKSYRYRDPLLIKLYAGGNVAPGILVGDLEKHRQLHEQTLADYRETEALYYRNDPEARQRYILPYMTLKLGMQFEEAWLRWYEEVRGVLDGTDGAAADR